MKAKEVFDVLSRIDMKAESLEGRPYGDCEVKVNKNSISIGGITIYPKKK